MLFTTVRYSRVVTPPPQTLLSLSIVPLASIHQQHYYYKYHHRRQDSSFWFRTFSAQNRFSGDIFDDFTVRSLNTAMIEGQKDCDLESTETLDENGN